MNPLEIFLHVRDEQENWEDNGTHESEQIDKLDEVDPFFAADALLVFWVGIGLGLATQIEVVGGDIVEDPDTGEKDKDLGADIKPIFAV